MSISAMKMENACRVLSSFQNQMLSEIAGKMGQCCESKKKVDEKSNDKKLNDLF